MRLCSAWRRLLLPLILSLIGVLPLRAAPIDAETPFPLQITDGLGRTVDLAQPPQRLVTIFSSNTELVAYLGLLAHVVGVEDYTRFPPAVRDIPKVGGRLGFSVDAIVALQPDLLIVTPARQAAHQLLEPMRRLDVPVLVLLSRSVDEVIDNLRKVARAAGVAQRGEVLAHQLQARVAAVRKRVAHRDLPRTVMITGRIGNGMLLVAKPNTYTGQAMTLAGTRDALDAPLAQVSPEAILLSQPDLLLYAGSQEAMDELLAQPGWRDLPAVRSGRVRTVARGEFLIPGPRTIDGIEHLAAWLHPLAEEGTP